MDWMLTAHWYKWAISAKKYQVVVCGFNILHYCSVSVWLFEKPRFRVRFYFLFCSVFSTQRTMNGFLCFNALQRWLSACVSLLILICSLNCTFNRDTRHSHDDEINCNCVLQCFINIYCLSNRPKNTHFFVRMSFSNVMILIQEFERSRLSNFQTTHVIIE